MVIDVKVIPRASQNRVLSLESNRYKVYLTAPALRGRADAVKPRLAAYTCRPGPIGRANEALVEMLVDYCHVSKTSVRILRGEKTRNKVIEIHGRE